MGLEEKTQKKEIDGTLYEVTPLPFGLGRPALVKILKILAPLLSAAFKSSGTTEEADKIAASAALFDALPSALSDDDLNWLAETFGTASRYAVGDKWIQLTKEQQNLHFAGRYDAFFSWIVFNVKVNYASFFDGIRKGAGAAELLKTVVAA